MALPCYIVVGLKSNFRPNIIFKMVFQMLKNTKKGPSSIDFMVEVK